MKTAIIALTAGGHELAAKICSLQDDCFVDTRKIPVFEKMASLWQGDVDGIICVMATGIVVRALAPLCRDKKQDPCVLVLDEKGHFVISLLSGHLGGGNRLAVELAAKLKAQPVITTASDVTGHTALDLWARKNGLLLNDQQKLTAMSAKLVNVGRLHVYADCEVATLPKDFEPVASWDKADIIISDGVYPKGDALILRPCALTVGLGCNRGTGMHDFETAVREMFSEQQLSRKGISGYASIDIKSDEQGMLDFAAKDQVPIQFFTKDELNTVDNITPSAVVFKATGAKGVAEPAAVLAAKTVTGPGRLIVRKRKWKDVTAAVATKKIRLVA